MDGRLFQRLMSGCFEWAGQGLWTPGEMNCPHRPHVCGLEWDVGRPCHQVLEEPAVVNKSNVPIRPASWGLDATF